MAKTKQKVPKSVAKRFKVTKTGKVVRLGSHVRHIRRKKSKSQVRAQKTPQQVTGAWEKKIKRILGKK